MSALILNANAMHIPLADCSVQCIITSPPYYGLRDYGTATWQGGDEGCEHTISMPTKWNDPKRGYDVLRPEVANRGGDSTRCHLCGAIRIDEQIGLEVTPDAYIANLVEVFRECKRILRDDGTLWVNIGDSYTSDGFNRNSVKLGSGIQADQRAKNPEYEKQTAPRGSRYYLNCNLKPKDLIGIPWMLAFALRADGWYLRQDIIWAKPNPMPESVKDRCTKSHEYIFLLSKSAKYYYDNEAIMEVATGYDGRKDTKYKSPVRNKRDVWTISTQPTREAHFATFPEKLVEPCILAGSKTGDIVFDPFMGSGTVSRVAAKFGRDSIGTELNLEYCKLSQRLLNGVQPVIDFAKA